MNPDTQDLAAKLHHESGDVWQCREIISLRHPFPVHYVSHFMQDSLRKQIFLRYHEYLVFCENCYQVTPGELETTFFLVCFSLFSHEKTFF